MEEEGVTNQRFQVQLLCSDENFEFEGNGDFSVPLENWKRHCLQLWWFRVMVYVVCQIVVDK